MTKPYGSNLLFALGILATLALAGCSESGDVSVGAPQTETAGAECGCVSPLAGAGRSVHGAAG